MRLDQSEGMRLDQSDNRRPGLPEVQDFTGKADWSGFPSLPGESKRKPDESECLGAVSWCEGPAFPWGRPGGLARLGGRSRLRKSRRPSPARSSWVT